MTVDQIRQFHRAEPFVPFDIHLADGRKLPVMQREFLALTPKGGSIGVAVGRDAIEIVDMRLVTSLKARKPRGRSR